MVLPSSMSTALRVVDGRSGGRSEHQKVCTELVDTRTKLDVATARTIALEAQMLQM